MEPVFVVVLAVIVVAERVCVVERLLRCTFLVPDVHGNWLVGVAPLQLHTSGNEVLDLSIRHFSVFHFQLLNEIRNARTLP